MPTTADIGREGERLVAERLRAEGCLIMERNWRCGRNEIDIIARKGEYILFVEVKTRAAAGWTSPESALTESKYRAFTRAVAAYMSMHDLWGEPRLDLAAVDIGPDGRAEIRYIENAFESHW